MFLIRRDPARTAEVEALSSYLEALQRGRDELPPDVDAELARVARSVRAELRPHEPRSQYVEELRLRLIAAADQRVPAEDAAVAWRQPRFIIGAAGLVSAAAVIALVARSRLQARAAA